MAISDGDLYGGPLSTLGIGNPVYTPSDRSIREAYDKMLATMAQQQSVLSPEQINQMTQQMLNGPPPLMTPPNSPQGTSTETLNQRAREMLVKRVGGIRAELKIVTGDFLMCHCYNDVVHVFYCRNGNSGVTQETLDLFPSDTLVTQFRMIFN